MSDEYMIYMPEECFDDFANFARAAGTYEESYWDRFDEEAILMMHIISDMKKVNGDD